MPATATAPTIRTARLATLDGRLLRLMLVMTDSFLFVGVVSQSPACHLRRAAWGNDMMRKRGQEDQGHDPHITLTFRRLGFGRGIRLVRVGTPQYDRSGLSEGEDR